MRHVNRYTIVHFWADLFKQSFFEYYERINQHSRKPEKIDNKYLAKLIGW